MISIEKIPGPINTIAVHDARRTVSSSYPNIYPFVALNMGSAKPLGSGAL
jgi:hypothetical protein